MQSPQAGLCPTSGLCALVTGKPTSPQARPFLGLWQAQNPQAGLLAWHKPHKRRQATWGFLPAVCVSKHHPAPAPSVCVCLCLSSVSLCVCVCVVWCVTHGGATTVSGVYARVCECADMGACICVSNAPHILASFGHPNKSCVHSLSTVTPEQLIGQARGNAAGMALRGRRSLSARSRGVQIRYGLCARRCRGREAAARAHGSPAHATGLGLSGGRLGSLRWAPAIAPRALQSLEPCSSANTRTIETPRHAAALRDRRERYHRGGTGACLCRMRPCHLGGARDACAPMRAPRVAHAP